MQVEQPIKDTAYASAKAAEARPAIAVETRAVYDTYFVLNGLHNGEEGVLAVAPSAELPQPDGWYWIRDNEDDASHGPFKSKDECKRDAEVLAARIYLLGHEFHPFNDHDWEGYAGADEGSFIAYGEGAALIWSPRANTLFEINEQCQRSWVIDQIGTIELDHVPSRNRG